MHGVLLLYFLPLLLLGEHIRQDMPRGKRHHPQAQRRCWSYCVLGPQALHLLTIRPPKLARLFINWRALLARATTVDTVRREISLARARLAAAAGEASRELARRVTGWRMSLAAG